jgi:hypothetical protein
MAAPAKYILERWDPAQGRRLETVSVQSTWFRESIVNADARVTRPPSTVQEIWQDPSGFIWVLLRDADSHWRAASGATRDGPVASATLDAQFDWVLEAVDPATGNVIGSLRSNREIWSRVPSGLVVSRNEASESRVAFDVWRPQLLRKEQQ